MIAQKIDPIYINYYSVSPSKYNIVGTFPIRSIVLGPVGSGKAVLLQSMILDIYSICFERIYIVSPSIDVHSSWVIVKDIGNIIAS